MKMRKSQITRNTKETQVSIALNIDGTGKRKVETAINFFNHTMDLFIKHGVFDIDLKAKGDTDIDDHHTIEDIGIVLGQAFNHAIGSKRGINRYGFFILPMDESLATVAIDFSGRYSFSLDCEFHREQVGDLSTELIYDFWDAFAQNAKVNLYIKVENGRNDHHQIEALFKCAARAIRMACEYDQRTLQQIPSTKGSL